MAAGVGSAPRAPQACARCPMRLVDVMVSLLRLAAVTLLVPDPQAQTGAASLAAPQAGPQLLPQTSTPRLTTTTVHAPGYRSVWGGAGLRVTEGWGYMDQNILQVHGPNGAPVVIFAALFFPCDTADRNATWLLYCATVWRSSDGAQSPTLQLGTVPQHVAVEAYQPPMLFHFNATLLIARWAQQSTGSCVTLSSIPCAWESQAGVRSGWRAEDAFAVPTGSLNYLGGAMDRNGGITIAGWLDLDGPSKSTLGVLHATLQPGGQWRFGELSHAGPIFESADFQPLYPQLTHTKMGDLFILTTLNSDARCPSSTRPGHINMGAMYRQLRLYRGTRREVPESGGAGLGAGSWALGAGRSRNCGATRHQTQRRTHTSTGTPACSTLRDFLTTSWMMTCMVGYCTRALSRGQPGRPQQHASRCQHDVAAGVRVSSAYRPHSCGDDQRRSQPCGV